MVRILRHADRVYCDHGGRRELGNVCHGGCHHASSRTRPLTDVDGKHRVALGYLCICNLLFNTNHGRAYPRTPWTRISRWLDRAIWSHNPDVPRGQCGNHCKYSDAKRSALAPRRFRNAIAAGQCNAHLPVQHSLSPEFSHGLLCTAVLGNRTRCRHTPFLPARSVKLGGLNPICPMLIRGANAGLTLFAIENLTWSG